MAAEVGEECGVAAVSLQDENAPMRLYRLLLDMQNRGQLSAGITTYNKKRPQIIDTHKEMGTVNEVFRTRHEGETEKIFSKYAGTMGIGHVRYATCGDEGIGLAQPFERHHGKTWKWFSVAFNGNLANYSALREELLKAQYCMVHNTDTEVIMYELMRALWGKGKPDMGEIFSTVTAKFDGAYNIVFLNADGDLVVLRDPLGFRPLSYTVSDHSVIAASESNALVNSGFIDFKHLEPGHMITINGHEAKIERFCEKSSKRAHCMFEWVYFSNVGSVIEGSPVYTTRRKLGIELAAMEPLNLNDDDYVVLYVPSSSAPAGSGYAEAVGMPLQEGLVRNRHVGRTFIDGKGNREDHVGLKFTILREVTKGRKLIVVDDSIVRGHTSKRLVSYLKERGGAKEVHLRISCPPIVSPCFYGIDMSTFDELIAARNVKDPVSGPTEKETEAIAAEVGADSLVYQTTPNLVKSIGLPKSSLCMACLNGDYPTPCGKTMCKLAMENAQNKICKRTCE
jgi:amidophosphoribosyltransferase